MPRYQLIVILVFLLISCHKEQIATELQYDSLSLDTIPVTNDTIPVGPSTDITPCSIWQGHVVAFVDTLAGGFVELTLISLKDWDKIYSAHSSSANFDTIVRNYAEGNIDQWSIPSETLARRLKSTYTDNPSNNLLHSLNNLLRTISADTIASVKGSQTVRYLCEECTKTYSYHINTNVTNAGASTKYRLRLVRTYRLLTKNKQ